MTDELAGRLVVQRLLPALISRTTRYAPFHRSVDPIEIVVAAAWLGRQVVRHRTAPTHVASSLLSDAIYTAFRQPLRRRSASETVRPIGHFVTMPDAGLEPTAFEELAEVVRTARCAGVPAHDLDLVRQLVQTGSPGVVARQRVSPLEPFAITATAPSSTSVRHSMWRRESGVARPLRLGGSASRASGSLREVRVALLEEGGEAFLRVVEHRRLRP